jgi:hypothetical protein
MSQILTMTVSSIFLPLLLCSSAYSAFISSTVYSFFFSAVSYFSDFSTFSGVDFFAFSFASISMLISPISWLPRSDRSSLREPSMLEAELFSLTFFLCLWSFFRRFFFYLAVSPSKRDLSQTSLVLLDWHSESIMDVSVLFGELSDSASALFSFFCFFFRGPIVPATFMFIFLISSFFPYLVVVSYPVLDISPISSSLRQITTFSGLKSV